MSAVNSWITGLIAGMCVLGEAASCHAEESKLPVDLLLTDIQKVLIKVRDATASDLLPALSDVNLDLRVLSAKDASGTVKLYVVEGGAGVKATTAQEIKLDLGPPEPSDKSQVSSSVAPLADAIIDAARSAKLAASRDPPLHLRRLEASIEFTVELDAKVGGGFTIIPVSVEAKTSSANTQLITLVFHNQD